MRGGVAAAMHSRQADVIESHSLAISRLNTVLLIRKQCAEVSQPSYS